MTAVVAGMRKLFTGKTAEGKANPVQVRAITGPSRHSYPPTPPLLDIAPFCSSGGPPPRHCSGVKWCFSFSSHTLIYNACDVQSQTAHACEHECRALRRHRSTRPQTAGPTTPRRWKAEHPSRCEAQPSQPPCRACKNAAGRKHDAVTRHGGRGR
jgi:hypothetical protein